MLDGKALGARLKELRVKNSITQSQLAEYLGVDQSYISKFESGQRQLSVLSLEKLAQSFWSSCRIGAGRRVFVSCRFPLQ